ncbi:LuxR C-terminal-related transcriptional regulator [Paenibacillus sp. SI8]|uniref:response regulator transcription factor n=1 Tax=unclassified Paenibacillus TaxID=185978 RepID=UPI00346752E4
MVKVIIADHQRLVCEGIKFILEKDDDIQLEGCAVNEEEALLLCQQFEPDVMIMDIHCSKGDLLDLVSQVFGHFSSMNIIILASTWDAHAVFKAVNSGVSGYLPKSIHPSELIMSVKSAALGLRVWHKDMPLEIFSCSMSRQAGIGKNPLLQHAAITDREIRIMKHVAEGKENREIAASMFMSVGTVKNAISHLLKKLGLRDRIELVIFTLKNDLI